MSYCTHSNQCQVQVCKPCKAIHLPQEDAVVEPEHMLSRGLWEDIALPALKKVSVLKLCTGQDATSSFSTSLYASS